MPFVCLTGLQTLTRLCLYLRGQHLSERQKRGPPTEALWTATECECSSGEFFGPLSWIMTEWERSHRDKGEGRQKEREREGKKKKPIRGRKEGDLNWCYLWVSVMIATEGHSGCGLIQWQTITELMGKWLCVRMCVCVSACLSVSGEQESMSMKSSSTVKLWGFWKVTAVQHGPKENRRSTEHPFKNKGLKITKRPALHMTWTAFVWNTLTSTKPHMRFRCLFLHAAVSPNCVPLQSFFSFLLISSFLPFTSVTLTPVLRCFLSLHLSHAASSSYLKKTLLWCFFSFFFFFYTCISLHLAFLANFHSPSPHILLLLAFPYFTPGCPCS